MVAHYCHRSVRAASIPTASSQDSENTVVPMGPLQPQFSLSWVSEWALFRILCLHCHELPIA